jgi:hypothetical protein
MKPEIAARLRALIDIALRQPRVYPPRAGRARTPVRLVGLERVNDPRVIRETYAAAARLHPDLAGLAD